MKRYLSLIALLTLLSIQIAAQTKQPTKPATNTKPNELVLKTQKDSLTYILGAALGMTSILADVDKPDMKIIEAAMTEYIQGLNRISQEEVALLNGYSVEALENKVSERNKTRADNFLQENKNKPGIQTIAGTEIQYKETGKIIETKTAEPNAELLNPLYTNYELDLTLKLQDGAVIYNEEKMWVRGAFRGVMYKGINKCLKVVKENQSYIFYLPPSEAFGNSFQEEGLKRIVQPNSLVICEMKVHYIEPQVEDIDIVEPPPASYPLPRKEDFEDYPVSFAADMAVYPGGEAAMITDLNKNMVIPQQDIDANVSGAIMVSFIIEKDGSVSDVKILRSITGASKELEKAAVNSVKKT